MKVHELVNYLNHIAGDLEVADIVILKGSGEDAEHIDLDTIQKELEGLKNGTAN